MGQRIADKPVQRFVLIALSIFLLSITATAQPGSSPYTWKPVIAGGGGFVPGIIYHPAQQGLAYARTDMGGAYRWENTAGQWVALTDMMDRTNSDYMGILSVAVDPGDTNRVYMECGKYSQSWAGTGAVLSSTDRGKSWTINKITMKIGGNEDGRGTGERLQVDPNYGSILFMGTTKDGLWKSSDYGASWARVTSFAPTNINFVIFVKSSGTPGSASQRVFAAVNNTAGQSLYRSDNGGTSWSVVSGQPTGVMAVRADIADSILYMTFSNSAGPNGATSGSVWKYNVNGGTWTNISPPTGSYGFSGISVYPKNPNIIIVSTLDRWSPGDEVYRSTDGGASWTPRLAGAKWDRSYAPYTSSVNPHWLAALAMDPFDSSKAMFGTGYGIWGCDNMSGATPTWYFKDNWLEETVPMQIVSPPFTSLLSAMGDYDGFRHDNVDASPPNRYSPAKGTTLSIAFAGLVPSKIVKAYNAVPYGAYSTDGGTTWRDFGGRGSAGYPGGTTAGGSWSIAVSADGSSIVWAPTGAPMSFSLDDGKIWSKCSGGVSPVSPVADRVNPRKFYAFEGGTGILWVSNNRGQAFSQGTTGLPLVGAGQDANVTAVPGYDGHVWICCSIRGLYRSTDGGKSAASVANVTEAYRLGFGKALHAGGYPAIYLHGTVNGTLGIYRSDDTGASWTRINDSNHQFGWVHQITGDPRVYGRCYVSAEGRGILYGEPQDSTSASRIPTTFKFYASSIDSLRQFPQTISVSWSRASDPGGKPLTYIIHFFGAGVDMTISSKDTSATFNAGDIQTESSYIITGYVTNGSDTTASSNYLSFQSTSELTAIQELAGNGPGSFALYQNYPNPFNPTTTISYLLPVVGFVSLRIFDILGREVSALVNEDQKAGRHVVTWEASLLPSGVYWYRLIAGDYIETKKMVVLK